MRVYRGETPGDAPVVICSELPTEPGSQAANITLIAGYLAAQVIKEHFPGGLLGLPRPLLWIEQRLTFEGGPQEYSLISFPFYSPQPAGLGSNERATLHRCFYALLVFAQRLASSCLSFLFHLSSCTPLPRTIECEAVESNEHLSLKRALEAAKRDLEAEYQRKAKILDDALAIVAEIGPNLQPADVVKLMPPGADTPSTEIDAERDAAVEEQLPEEQRPERAQDRMREDAPTPNGESRPFKLIDEIKQAIREFEGHAFTQRDVTSKIIEKHPDKAVHPGSVSTALGKMAKQSKLKLVKPAHGGSDPAIYREGTMFP